MIEMPEAFTLANQMNSTLIGKTIETFERGNLTHKFLWLNRPIEEYQALLTGRTITHAASYGRSLYLHLDGGHLLWWTDFGGRILYHQVDQPLPPKMHLIWSFGDGSHMTYALQMWGAVRLVSAGQFDERPFDEAGIEPLSPEFTIDRFNDMLDTYPEKNSKGIKGFLVATGYVTQNSINGLGNAYVQDILFEAGLNPRRKTPTLEDIERNRLYKAIRHIIQQAITLGGRSEERDLFNQPGGYHRRMDSSAVGTPCPDCSTPVQKIQYLGGACYYCPNCQPE